MDGSWEVVLQLVQQVVRRVGTGQPRQAEWGLQIRPLHMLLRRSCQREMNIGSPWVVGSKELG